MEIYMVHSYKGGTGKSLFSINLCNILSEEFGKKVLLIEADFEMPSYTKIFKSNKTDMYFNQYLNQMSHGLEPFIYQTNNQQFDVVYASPNYDPNDLVHSTDFSWFNKILLKMKNDLSQLDYDVVVFDLAPGKNLFTINTLALSNVIMILMRPDEASVENTIEIFSEFYEIADFMKQKHIEILINQIPKDPRMYPLLDNWTNMIRYRLDINNTVNYIHFESETGYNVASNNTILPKNDPFRSELLKLLEKLFTE